MGIGLSELLKLKEKDPESYREALYKLFVNLDAKSKKGEINAEVFRGGEEALYRLFEEEKIYIAFINRTEGLGKCDDLVILVGRKVLLSTFDLTGKGFEKIENPPKLDLLGSVLFAELIKLYLNEIIGEDEEVRKDIRKEWEFYRRCLLTLIEAGLFRKGEDIKTLHNFINEHIQQKEISGKQYFHLAHVGNIEDVKNVLDAVKNEKRLVLIFNNKYNWFLLFKWSEENQRFEKLLYRLHEKLIKRLDEILEKGTIESRGQGDVRKENGGGLVTGRETARGESETGPLTKISQTVKVGSNIAMINSKVEGDVNVELNYFNIDELKQILEERLGRMPTKEDLENFASNMESLIRSIMGLYPTMGEEQMRARALQGSLLENMIEILKNQILGQDFNLKYGKFLKVLDEEFTKNLISFVIKKAFYEIYEKDRKTLKRFQSPEDIANVLSEYVKIINTEVPKAIGHELLKKLLEEKVERKLVIEFFGEYRDILEKFKQAFEKEDEVVLEILGEEIKYSGKGKEKMKELINEIYKELTGSKVEESKKEEKIKEIIKLASEIKEYLEKWKEELSDEKEKETATSLINSIDTILKEEYLRNLSLNQLNELLKKLKNLREEIEKEEQALQVTKEEAPAPPKKAPEEKPSEAPPPTKPITSPGLSRILNTCGQILGWTLIAVGTPIIALGLATALLPLYALYKMKDQIKSITPDIGKALEVFK